MPRQPVDLEVHQEVCSPAADVALRRRLRSLEGAFPAVRGWWVALAPQPAAAGSRELLRFEARVAATIVGGEVFEAQGSGVDVLAALRVALNALERQLQEESDGARHRAGEWLAKVKSRLSPFRIASTASDYS